MVAFPASLCTRPVPLTPACPGQYTHRSFRRWMSNIDTFRSGLPIPLFTFCSKLTESVGMMACVVWLENYSKGTELCWLLLFGEMCATINTVSVTTSLIHPLSICLTFSLCTPLPGSFVLLQAHRYFASPIVKLKPLANALSRRILCLLISISFLPYYYLYYCCCCCCCYCCCYCHSCNYVIVKDYSHLWPFHYMAWII